MSALRGPAWAVALAVAYVAASHWLMTRATTSAWAALVILAPSLLGVAAYGWRVRSKTLVLACAIGVAGLLGWALRDNGVAPTAAPGLDATSRTARSLARMSLGTSTSLLYLTQHVAIHIALALVFAATLRRGATPLISALAARVHRTLTPAMAVYTRHVTQAWVVYFAAMAVLSLLLYGFAPFDAWAVFANLVTPLAVAAMFIGEYRLRYRWHPEFERTSWRDAVAAYRAHAAEQKRGQSARGGNSP